MMVGGAVRAKVLANRIIRVSAAKCLKTNYIEVTEPPAARYANSVRATLSAVSIDVFGLREDGTPVS